MSALPRQLLSPRMFVMPAVALAVILGLANTSGRAVSGEASASRIYRAVNCVDAGKAGHAVCTVARDSRHSIQ